MILEGEQWPLTLFLIYPSSIFRVFFLTGTDLQDLFGARSIEFDVLYKTAYAKFLSDPSMDCKKTQILYFWLHEWSESYFRQTIVLNHEGIRKAKLRDCSPCNSASNETLHMNWSYFIEKVYRVQSWALASQKSSKPKWALQLFTFFSYSSLILIKIVLSHSTTSTVRKILCTVGISIVNIAVSLEDLKMIRMGMYPLRTHYQFYSSSTCCAKSLIQCESFSAGSL